MKLSLFNRPYVGPQGKVDRAAVVSGIVAIATVVVSYPWIFLGG